VISVVKTLFCIAIFVSIGINFANIVGRYVFLAPIIWAEEILIFLMVWCVFLGSVMVTWEGRHIKMDLISIALPSPFKEIVNFLGAATLILVCLFVGYQAFVVTGLMTRLDQKSVVAEIPMTIPHAAILVGAVAMAIAAVWRFRSHVTGAFGSDTEAATKQVTEAFATDKTKEDAQTR